MPDDDEVRSIRFNRDVWDILERLEQPDQLDRSKHSIVNRAVRRFDEQLHNARTSFPPPSPDAGVSTYRATIEFQLPAMIWSDAQAYQLFFEFQERLKLLAPNQQEAYGQIDAIRPMDYDPRFADVRLPGSNSLHKTTEGKPSWGGEKTEDLPPAVPWDESGEVIG